MNPAVSRFINRELSWLEFNQRVLDEACDESVPLLERLNFLAITASNLDEFAMVRVGSLRMLSQKGSNTPDPAGMTPDQQLAAVSVRMHEMVKNQYSHFNKVLAPALAAAGIKRQRPADLHDRQHKVVQHQFENEIYTVLTPIAVTSDEDCPWLLNQTLNMAVRLSPESPEEKTFRFAIIPFARFGYRFITVPSDGGYEYMLLEDVVEMFIQRFFPGEKILETAMFRITRNADLSIRDDLAGDLLAEMEEILDARKQADCVRLELAEKTSDELLAFLQQLFTVAQTEIYRIDGPLDLSSQRRLNELQGFEHLKYESWPPRRSTQIDPTVSMFEILSRQDVLLCHPYESFEPVVRLVEEAAADPDVLAIKQILYRTSSNSPIVSALMRAAQQGKYVTAIVELKARFDEARNIEWAKNLEQAEVQVIYGVKGLKTHAKLCVIVRRESHGIQRYVHFGTGNYNENTARLYSDISYLTSNEELAADATSFFNAITGYSQPLTFRRIEAAPLGLRDKLLEMIRGETERKRHGQKATITAKFNSLSDPQIIEALYEASQEGVKIRLNIRGICCLRPGVPGLSENISVVSIIDRYLEHGRVLWFYHGGDNRVFISSADWMSRNLDRRVELLVPIDDPACRDRLISILEEYFLDTVKAHRLLPDGRYEPIKAVGRRKRHRSQESLYQQVTEAVNQAEQSRRTVFEPHRAPGTEQ